MNVDEALYINEETRDSMGYAPNGKCAQLRWRQVLNTRLSDTLSMSDELVNSLKSEAVDVSSDESKLEQEGSRQRDSDSDERQRDSVGDNDDEEEEEEEEEKQEEEEQEEEDKKRRNKKSARTGELMTTCSTMQKRSLLLLQNPHLPLPQPLLNHQPVAGNATAKGSPLSSQRSQVLRKLR